MRNVHLFWETPKKTPLPGTAGKQIQIYKDLQEMYELKCKKEFDYYLNYDECENMRFFLNKMKEKYNIDSK